MAVGPAYAIADTCASDVATCKVGDVGPGGGIVFYDAGSTQWWGRFLEAKTTSVPANGIWGTSSGIGTQAQRIATKQLGMGRGNSVSMAFDSNSVYTRQANSAFRGGFFLPSKDELDALYNYWKISGDTRLQYHDAPMWSSTEASATFAWYQLFQDGTQFTDANGIIPKLAGNKDFLMSPVHVGSGFKAIPFEVIGVSAFPNTGANWPTSLNAVAATTANPSCSAGGANTVCNIGDIGPGGGIVFYDAGKDEYWGRYLEIAPKSCEGVKIPWRPAGNTKTVYRETNGQTAAEMRLLAKGVGMGKVNTRIITLALGAGSYAAKYAEDLNCSGVDDWFLPSKDELDLAYNRLAQNRVGGQDTPVGGFNKGYYWTSTDYNNTTAWTEYFMDGQQFDRVQTLSGNNKPPANPFRVRPIRAFGTNNVVLSCAQGGTCKLGDIGPGGGKVFYVAPDLLVANGKRARYMEVSTNPNIGEMSLCDRNPKVLPTRPGIGSGMSNTKILENLCDNVFSVDQYVIGGKSDWFIPSIEELVLAMNFLGRTASGEYWSSTTIGTDQARSRGGQNEYGRPRYYSLDFLPVRAFG